MDAPLRPPATPDLNNLYVQAHADTFPLDMTRRRFLRNSGALIGGVMVANELATIWSNEVYQSNGTELRIVGGENIHSPLLIVSFGGEGNDNDYTGAQQMYLAGNKKIPAADMVYDNRNGLNFKDMATVLHESQKERGFEYLVICGDSEGAMIGMFAALCAEDIPVAAFIANSGIMKLGNAKFGAQLTAKLVTSSINPPINLVKDTELAAKDIFCYFRDHNTGASYPFDLVSLSALLGLPHEIFRLPDQMAQSASPSLQISELNWAEIINFPKLAHLYKKFGIISRDFTEAIYLQAARDNTINPNGAFRDWHNLFLSNFGIYMHRHYMRPGSRHADVYAAGALLHQMSTLERIFDRFQPTPKPTLT